MRFTTVHLALGLYTAGALGLDARQDNSNQNNGQTGNAQDTSWQDLTCEEHNIGNSGVQLTERWGISRADNAWALALQNWKAHRENPDRRKNFTGDFAVTFGAKDGYNCEDIGNDNCNDIIECDDAKAGPAGSIILNSFAALHMLYSEIHTSVYHAAEGLSAAAFAETFAPNSGNEAQMAETFVDAALTIFTVGVASGFRGVGQVLTKVPGLVKELGGGRKKGSSKAEISSDKQSGSSGQASSGQASSGHQTSQDHRTLSNDQDGSNRVELPSDQQSGSSGRASSGRKSSGRKSSCRASSHRKSSGRKSSGRKSSDQASSGQASSGQASSGRASSRHQTSQDHRTSSNDQDGSNTVEIPSGSEEFIDANGSNTVEIPESDQHQKRWNRRWAAPQDSEAGSSEQTGNDNNAGGNGKGSASDLSYGLAGNLGAWMKGRVTPNDEGLDTLMSIDKALAQIVDNFGQAISKYVEDLFSGADDQVTELFNLMARGGIMDVAVNLNQITQSTKKLIGAKLIEAAWTVAPEGAGAHPFILRTDQPCGLDGSIIIPGGYDKFIRHDDMRNSRACYNDTTVLLLNGWRKGDNLVNPGDSLTGWGATALIGVDKLNEGNSQFAGITRDDIAFSAMKAYEKNGNTNKDMGSSLDYDGIIRQLQNKQFNMMDYDDVVRAPGVWNIPVCEGNKDSLENNLRTVDPQNSKYWPCNAAPDSKYNSVGTRVHVNNGCILVANTSICAEGLKSGKAEAKKSITTIPDPDDGTHRNHAMIYAQVTDRTDSDKTYAKCGTDFSWPSNFGDIYFGEDNKLYDSNGQEIKTDNGQEQVCTELNGNEGKGEVIDNPYFFEA